jgi:hypothetical protein
MFSEANMEEEQEGIGSFEGVVEKIFATLE